MAKGSGKQSVEEFGEVEAMEEIAENVEIEETEALLARVLDRFRATYDSADLLADWNELAAQVGALAESQYGEVERAMAKGNAIRCARVATAGLGP